MARIDPLRNFRYRLEIDGITQAALQRGDDRRDDHRRGRLPRGHRPAARAQALRAHQVRQHHAEVGPLPWAATRSTSSSGTRTSPPGQVKAKRKKVVIVVQDEAGADAARFVVSEAWPIKYDPTDLNAKGNEVMIELLELVNEGIERVQVRSRT